MTGGNGSNGNGSQPAALVPTNGNGAAVTSGDARPFQPGPRDWAILEAWIDLYAEKKPTSLANIGHLCGITKQSVHKRTRKPGFQAWWGQELRTRQRLAWNETMLKRIIRAADDSESFRLLLPIMEPQAVPAPSLPGQLAPQQQAFVVNIHK